MQIDLIYLTSSNNLPEWPLGHVFPVTADTLIINELISDWLREGDAAYLLFWDAELGNPQPQVVHQVAETPGDVWHGGLRLGFGTQPQLIDFVNPVWRFNRDPDPQIVATSWRLSLQACLVKREVLQQLGGPDDGFDTLTGASLELGYRWHSCGALLQHVPELVNVTRQKSVIDLSLADEFRFIRRHYGQKWAVWAFLRAVASGYSTIPTWQALQLAQHNRFDLLPEPFQHKPHMQSMQPQPTVSVLIPTIDRYPYLFQLLDQLRTQTVPPLEIIVIDQTPIERRDTIWPAQFADLPIRTIQRDQAGQCSSRNFGLQRAQGETILFLDDDIEIPPDLIQNHLHVLEAYDQDGSCGVVEEIGAGALPYAFTYRRSSDVFPAGNTLLKTCALEASGLFDMAYETGSRADGDLGMRLYLAGKTLILNPAAKILHLHAPRGGLRQHGARAITRAGSRSSLWQRHLLAATEGYLWCRYFTLRQVREALLIRTFATLRGGNGRFRSLIRFLIMLVALPITYKQNLKRLQQGRNMLQTHPTIPTFRTKQHNNRQEVL
ncbi:MAG: glycosyltransferase family 2 protein [Chloroflexi bacterium]|nr:MAG: glycosyltransferase family 2 protein [Chloroflexota bacterium]